MKETAFISIALLLASQTAYCQQNSILTQIKTGVEVSSEIDAAVNEVEEPYKTSFDVTLDGYNKLAQAVNGHQKPPKPDHPYSIDGLADQIQQLADKLSAAPLAPNVNASGYTVSVQQLASCVSQDEAVATLHQYANDMDTAVGVGQSSLQTLNQFEQGLDTLSVDVRLFTQLAAIGANAPDLDWAEYFSSAYWDLDQHLATAIAHLKNATREQIQRITNNIAALQAQSGNLKSNLQVLRPNWCILAGNWSGQCHNNQFGLVTSAALIMTNSGNQGGTFDYNGQPMTTRSLNLSNKINLQIQFGAQQSPSTLQGNFDATYHQFVGTFAVPRSPGLTSTCRLSGSGS